MSRVTLVDRYLKRVRGADYGLVLNELLKITPGKKTSLQRSIRLHKGLPVEVVEFLRGWPRLPGQHVIDNHYLMGTGGHSKDRLSPEWAIAALEILRDEFVKADDFKNKICRAMRKATELSCHPLSLRKCDCFYPGFTNLKFHPAASWHIRV